MDPQRILFGLAVMVVGPCMSLFAPRRFLYGLLTLLPGRGPRVFGAVAFFAGGLLIVLDGLGTFS
jgi:hypothetical protein